jgi:hypothetical protein
VRRALQYCVGLPIALVAAHATTVVLTVTIENFPCWLALTHCAGIKFEDPLDSVRFLPQLYGHGGALLDNAIGYIPPFVGIACPLLLMRCAPNSEHLLARIAFIAAIGLFVGAISGVALYVLYNQPTPFDFTAFWNGTPPLHVFGWPPLDSFDDTAVFGIIASLLIWAVTFSKHEV